MPVLFNFHLTPLIAMLTPFSFFLMIVMYIYLLTFAYIQCAREQGLGAVINSIWVFATVLTQSSYK
ncbi:hypothetical protein N473_04065 [Pseudoalteromonas luteoviolacea CPMOR-1]|uniref:Uncharacterized protein n=1 Tax=Pseudoalteromonas luteoviolacea CPMOR-1 TaxID=1365248 RepID=A0A161XXL7_9GAMM|nr:hypothetical protein N473_04065 [Pseudoalteromonas luteoviolacea CPMOR-1]